MDGRGSAHVWAALVMVLASLAAVTVTSVAGTPATDVLQVIATVVVPTSTVLLVGRQIATRVGDVHREVNGRMTELVQKLPPGREE